MKPEFYEHVSLEHIQISNFTKFHPGADLFHVNGQMETDAQTDRHDEDDRRIRNFGTLLKSTASPYVQCMNSLQQARFVIVRSVVTSRSAGQAALPACSGR